MQSITLPPLFFALLSLGITACTSDKQDSNIDSSLTASQSVTETQLPGTYFALLPCSDCRGIQINLVLNADKQYEQTAEYLGRNDDVLFEDGNWSYLGGNLQLKPTTKSGKQSRQFRANDHQLILLDEKGAEHNTANTKRYILEKR